MLNLKNRVALVTGAESGIGRAIAIRLAEQGADVAVNYLRQEHGEATGRSVAQACDRIRSSGCRELLIDADVTSESQVVAMVQQVVDTWGRLDILVNNAGIQIERPSHELTAADFDRVLAVNLRGAFLCSREALRHFLARGGGGVILNNSSVHELIPKPGFLSYSASKAGLCAMTRTLALEYGPHDIRVNAVAPGVVETPINAWLEDPQKRAEVEQRIPLRRIIPAEEIAGVFAFLASDAARSITGQTIFVDGGLSCYPSFAENWTS